MTSILKLFYGLVSKDKTMAFRGHKDLNFAIKMLSKIEKFAVAKGNLWVKSSVSHIFHAPLQSKIWSDFFSAYYIKFELSTLSLFWNKTKTFWPSELGAVHTYTDESSAHTKRVIVNYSHGHLFSPDDIIMEIPMQDRTISMNPYIVKVGSQAWLITSLMQTYK